MKLHGPVLFASILALVAVDASIANAKHRHGARHATAAPVAVARPSSFDPPRMIEVRPGVIISSWDCITDEGYGRWRPCGSGRR